MKEFKEWSSGFTVPKPFTYIKGYKKESLRVSLEGRYSTLATNDSHVGFWGSFKPSGLKVHRIK